MPFNERDGFGSARLITEDDTAAVKEVQKDGRCSMWEKDWLYIFLDLGKLDPLAEPCMSGTRPFSPALYQDK
jgi:hypothetical protein